MPILNIVASISAMVHTGLAGIGWFIFIVSFGVINTDIGFFERLDQINTLPPATASTQRELLYARVNAHNIVAVLSPFLFIVMIVMSILMMVLKKRWMPYVCIILSFPIFILVGFVLPCGGAVLNTYSQVITMARHEPTPRPVEGTVGAMFAGLFMETIFLIGALISLYTSAILMKSEDKEA